MNPPLLQVEHLTKSFVIRRKKFTAIHDLCFSIAPGKTLGLIGESGCGKSTLGRLLMRLYEPDAGRILFQGHDITRLSGKHLKTVRSRIQMIFQNPFASLDPRMTVEAIISEPLVVHFRYNTKENRRTVSELLDLVNLPHSALNRFPHEFSSGQQQRIAIARALALHPELIICDEPTASLDISIQAQIVNLLLSLQKECGVTYLFISHDLAVTKILSNQIAVMYLGEFVEIGAVETIYTRPLHPYTQSLLSSVIEHPIQQGQQTLQGEPPSLFNYPQGCAFCTRCPKARPLCLKQKPPLNEQEPDHFVRCFASSSGSWN